MEGLNKSGACRMQSLCKSEAVRFLSYPQLYRNAILGSGEHKETQKKKKETFVRFEIFATL
jgi:hypothetical protein